MKDKQTDMGSLFLSRKECRLQINVNNKEKRKREAMEIWVLKNFSSLILVSLSSVHPTLHRSQVSVPPCLTLRVFEKFPSYQSNKVPFTVHFSSVLQATLQWLRAHDLKSGVDLCNMVSVCCEIMYTESLGKDGGKKLMICCWRKTTIKTRIYYCHNVD